ncbi:hypothetical protein H0H92_011112 [Tricholoma furcatifolium]|nr:hypothetical protein H0H92_011112 [Tricholoma furcatifolium]
MHLLILAAVRAFFYLRYQRHKAATKSHRFSQALEKRMSTISTDWKSMSAASAAAAIRSSMAVGDRTSSAFAFCNIRHTSQFDLNAQEYDEKDLPEMPQMKQRMPSPPSAARTATHPSAHPLPTLNILSATSPTSTSPFTLSIHHAPPDVPALPHGAEHTPPRTPPRTPRRTPRSPSPSLPPPHPPAVRKSTLGLSAPPSSVNATGAGVGAGAPGTPKVKGRKLSIYASLAMLKKGRESPAVSLPMVISSPMPILTPTMGVSAPVDESHAHVGGMAGVGSRNFAGMGAGMNMGMGMGAGPAYAIREDEQYGHEGEEMDYEDEYVGTAN